MPLSPQERFTLEADLAAYGIDRWKLHYRWTWPSAHLQRQLRTAERWANRPGPRWKFATRVQKVRCRRQCARLGCEIPPGVAGPGFSIAHLPGIVINETASLGRNCRIHQNVTIGAARAKSPRLGDNVWVGAGAVIIGDITVGDGAAIAANAVVTRDVPPGVTVGGIPATVISDNDSAAWLIDACGIAAARLSGP